MDKNINSLIISPNDTIKKAMEVIEDTGFRCVLVADKNSYLMGILTDGDIRKCILKEINLNLSVKVIMNANPIVLGGKYSLKEAKDIMIKNGITLIPVVDKGKKIIDYLHLPDIISELEKNGEFYRQNRVKSKARNILVIGGAGYIGSVLVRRLLDEGYNVRAMDILLYGDESIKELYKNKNFEFMRGDCRNMQDVICALDGMDSVVHLGEIVGDPACSLSPDFTIEVNFMATKTLAEVCCHYGINRFIFSSSCSVYGANDKELEEDSKLNPVSLYARCKVESEKAILSINDDYFSPVILRLATVYGFSYRPRFDLVINLLTAKAVTEKKIKIFGGEQWRPFVSINDVSEAIICALRAEDSVVKREIFNVGSNNQNYKLHEVGDLIKKAMPEVEIEIKKDIVDKRNYRVKFDKINRHLGFECRNRAMDEILMMRDKILKAACINIDDPKYSNYRTFIGAEAG